MLARVAFGVALALLAPLASAIPAEPGVVVDAYAPDTIEWPLEGGNGVYVVGIGEARYRQGESGQGSGSGFAAFTDGHRTLTVIEGSVRAMLAHSGTVERAEGNATLLTAGGDVPALACRAWYIAGATYHVGLVGRSVFEASAPGARIVVMERGFTMSGAGDGSLVLPLASGGGAALVQVCAGEAPATAALGVRLEPVESREAPGVGIVAALGAVLLALRASKRPDG